MKKGKEQQHHTVGLRRSEETELLRVTPGKGVVAMSPVVQV
jgi:hypothetical protein